MSVMCYAAAGKTKAPALCGAFAVGAGGGAVLPDSAGDRLAGPMVVVGSSEKNLARVDRILELGAPLDWYYVDGAYGFGRGTHFRVARRALQADPVHGREDSARWHAFGLEIKPWRKAGAAIVIATQSDLWHRWSTGRSAAGWAAFVAEDLRRFTDREIVVCAHKGEYPLAEALRNAFALVTHSSSAAMTACLEGVPTFCLETCAASAFSLKDLARIERPFYADDEIRRRAFWRLAAAQWTREELAAGAAWRALNP